MGMVGGGRGAFIGGVHRMAAALDGHVELVCGAFSADPDTSRASGADLLLAPDRCYGSWRELIDRESERPEADRIDFVSIVTPNHLHHPVAMAALERGFDVVCDKPMTLDLAQALELRDAVEATGRLFCLTHNYTGYPMVKEARHQIAEGRLGPIRKVVVEYPQGWLATPLEASGQKQAAWRTDPARAGAAGCMGDIGTHCFQLVEHVTGLEAEAVCSDLTTFVPGRRLDDDGSVLLRFAGGARGVLHASQVAVGEENALRLRVYGERGGLDWRQEEPNTLLLRWPGRPPEIRRTAGPGVSAAAARATRLPMGHPEGFIEAFANLYRDFALAIEAQKRGERVDPAVIDYPGVRDGVRGMRFLEAVIESAGHGWVAIESDAAVRARPERRAERR
jgi:predicted dehydrogenase